MQHFFLHISFKIQYTGMWRCFVTPNMGVVIKPKVVLHFFVMFRIMYIVHSTFPAYK